MPSKGASLLPQDFAVGGAVPDGDYLMKSVSTDLFDYGGKSQGGSSPALCVLFVDDDGAEYTQHYSAGKTEFLIPSDDSKRFVHPGGGEAKISKSSNCAMFIGSLLTSGFPQAGLSDDVSAFAGHRVKIENREQPKRPGIKDEKEGKTIPLAVKYLGEAKGGARSVGGRPATHQTQSTAASPASSTTSHGSNGADLQAKAIAMVQAILSEAPEHTTTAVKLASTAMLRLSKVKDPDTMAIKKLITSDWLMEHAVAGNWVSDGESVVGVVE